MDADEVLDLIDEIELSGRPVADRATELEALAQDLAPGTPGRADVLLAAAGCRQLLGDLAAALRLVERAEQDDSEALTHPAVVRLHIALAGGDADAEAAAATYLRDQARRDALGVEDYLVIGELFEEHGRLQQALRWFTLPYTYAEPDDPDLDRSCLPGRLRTRTALGKPRDRFDQLALRRLPGSDV